MPTIQIDLTETEYQRLLELARQQRVTPQAVARQALARYLAQSHPLMGLAGMLGSDHQGPEDEEAGHRGSGESA